MSESEDTPVNPTDQGKAGRAAWEVPGELKPLEARLASLLPRDDRLDRERLMFLAGQASVPLANHRWGRVLEAPGSARTWQVAFAGMTVVAASLLALVVIRPAVVEPSATHVRDVAKSTQWTQSSQRIPDERNATRDDVLSTGDAYHRDIERLLAAREVLPADVNAAVRMPAAERDHPALTPAAWRQILNGSDSARLPGNDSSSLPRSRGINS